MLLRSFLSDAMHLLYPHHCLGCGSDILAKTELLCLRCIYELPHTRFEKFQHNPVEKIFWGRFPFRAAHSEFYFSKGQLIQHLMHELKYHGNLAIGEWLGALMGKILLQSGRFSGIDYLLPLPLYPDRERQRGYNQAEIICRGLSLSMHIPQQRGNLVRTRNTSTQTKKHRTERWDNVSGGFRVQDPDVLAGKHVLLVDDVITTGASLEACARAMLAVPGIQVSLATLAIASK